MKFPKPKVVVSSCLEFEKIRYNGQVIPSTIVKDLMPYVEFIKVCPEYEIGLGVPREPIRIIKVDGENRLVQQKTEKDVTDDMNNFTEKFISNIKYIDGFIFKSKSPTMGVKNIKVYIGLKTSNVVERCGGFFAGKIAEKFQDYPIEEDDRLRNKKIREYFLTQIFLFAKYRDAFNNKKLLDFHKNNGLLFRFYNKKLLKNLDPSKEDYFEKIKEIISKYPEFESILDFFKEFKDKVDNEEKFLILLEDYQNNKVSFHTIKKVLEFQLKDKNLLSQSFFNLYPKGLEADIEEDRNRDYWSNRD